MRCGLMQPAVRAVFVVIESEAHPLLYPFVHRGDVVEHALVLRLVPIPDRIDMLYVRAEIAPRKRAEPVDKIARVLHRNVSCRQHAVDEHAQFGVVEQSGRQPAPSPVRRDVIPCLAEQRKIAPHCFALHDHTVFVLQDVNYLLLFQMVVGVGVMLQDLQHAKQRKFFGFHDVLPSPPPLIGRSDDAKALYHLRASPTSNRNASPPSRP